MNFDSVSGIVGRLAQYAVIGAYAMAARGYLRQTTDFDIMTADHSALDESTWRDLAHEGYSVDLRRGDFDDPLHGVVRFRREGDTIDLVVVKYRWQEEVLDRAEVMAIFGVQLPIVRTSDLILLKLFAGGYLDTRDVLSLLAVGPRPALIAEVEQTLSGLPDEMRRLWKTLLAESDPSRTPGL